MYTKAKFLVSSNTFLCVVLLYVLTIYIFTFSPSSLSCIAFHLHLPFPHAPDNLPSLASVCASTRGKEGLGRRGAGRGVALSKPFTKLLMGREAQGKEDSKLSSGW